MDNAGKCQPTPARPSPAQDFDSLTGRMSRLDGSTYHCYDEHTTLVVER